MCRIVKVLNHNTVIAIDENADEQYLIMRKGIGFRKKIMEKIDLHGNEAVYLLQKIPEHNERMTGDETRK